MWVCVVKLINNIFFVTKMAYKLEGKNNISSPNTCKKILTADLKAKPAVNFQHLDRKWYPKMVPAKGKGLLDHYKREELVSHLVVCYTKWQPTYQYVQYLYSYFDSYVEFYQYVIHMNQKDWSFYEVINFFQKPHFDIDIPIKELMENYYPENTPNIDFDTLLNIGNLLIDHIIQSCVYMFKPNILNVEKDILLYTSHGKDKISFFAEGKKTDFFKEKISYHIIIDNWYHYELRPFLIKCYNIQVIY
jgi:hypothetical protein